MSGVCEEQAPRALPHKPEALELAPTGNIENETGNLTRERRWPRPLSFVDAAGGTVEIESEWTARRRERVGSVPTLPAAYPHARKQSGAHVKTVRELEANGTFARLDDTNRRKSSVTDLTSTESKVCFPTAFPQTTTATAGPSEMSGAAMCVPGRFVQFHSEVMP